MKLGRCFSFLNNWYGFEHGGDRKSNPNNYGLKTQKQLADEMGISIPTLQNYKLLADMIPELEDLIYTGIKAAPLVVIRRAIFYSMSKSSSNVILRLGNMTICKSSLFCSVTVL